MELCAGVPVVYVKIQVRSCWHLCRLYGLVVVREDMAMERSLVLCSSSLGGRRQVRQPLSVGRVG